MALKQLTLNMQANTGYVIALSAARSGVGYSSVKMRTTQVTWVKTGPYSDTVQTFPTPTAPSTVAGTTNDYYKLAVNEVKTFGYELPKGGAEDSSFGTNSDRIQYLFIYATAVGDLTIDAH